MRGLILSAVMAIFVLFPINTEAQQHCGMSVNVDYALMNMWSKQAETRDIVRLEEFNPGNGFWGSATHMENNPVPITTGRSYSLKGSFFNRRCGSSWGFGLKGWFFNSSAPEFEEVRTDEGLPGLRGVRVQDASIFPGFDNREPMGMAPIVRGVDNRVFPWVADALAVRSLVENGSTSGLSMIIGARLAGYQDQSVEVMYQNIFYGSVVELENEPNHHYEIDLLMQDQAISDQGMSVGPTLGLSGYLREGNRLLLKGTIQQSVVFGTASQTGVAVYLEEYFLSKGDPFDSERYYREWTTVDQNTFDAKERSAIHISDIELGVTVAITKRIALNAGGFISIWNNVPSAPKWSALTEKWTTTKESPVFAGIELGGAFRWRAF